MHSTFRIYHSFGELTVAKCLTALASLIVSIWVLLTKNACNGGECN
jgi:hypothetical protein